MHLFENLDFNWRLPIKQTKNRKENAEDSSGKAQLNKDYLLGYMLEQKKCYVPYYA